MSKSLLRSRFQAIIESIDKATASERKDRMSRNAASNFNYLITDFGKLFPNSGLRLPEIDGGDTWITLRIAAAEMIAILDSLEA